jgi:hypothetical protein
VEVLIFGCRGTIALVVKVLGEHMVAMTDSGCESTNVCWGALGATLGGSSAGWWVSSGGVTSEACRAV